MKAGLFARNGMHTSRCRGKAGELHLPAVIAVAPAKSRPSGCSHLNKPLWTVKKKGQIGFLILAMTAYN